MGFWLWVIVIAIAYVAAGFLAELVNDAEGSKRVVYSLWGVMGIGVLTGTLPLVYTALITIPLFLFKRGPEEIREWMGGP